MHPTQPIAAPIESLDWIVGSWAGGLGADRYEDGEAVFLMRGDPRWMVYRREPATGELVAYFESEASPHSPDDEFRYAQR